MRRLTLLSDGRHPPPPAVGTEVPACWFLPARRATCPPWPTRCELLAQGLVLASACRTFPVRTPNLDGSVPFLPEL